MSDHENQKVSLTRRSFLKATGVIAGATAITGAGGASLALAADYERGQTQVEGEQIFRGTCRPNCQNFCHLNLHVRDGLLVKTSRAPYKDPKYDRICHRGLCHVQRVYDPERLRYPLRRVEGTERGAGQWERISWDEALEEITQKIKSYQEEFGNQAVVFYTLSGNASSLHQSFYNRLKTVMKAGTIAACVDAANQYGARRIAGEGTQSYEGNEFCDLPNAKAIVAWGANVTEAQVHAFHFFKEAQQGGTKLVVIDPLFTNLASKADLWIPIRPATDTAMYMGLMNIFIDRDVIDREYLASKTCAPFLVKESDGKFLRGSDVGIQPVSTGETDKKTGEPKLYDTYMVLEGGELKKLEDATMPSIEGEYSREGIRCQTSFDLLKKKVADYDIQKVSEITDVPAETINELAEICLDIPVSHVTGFGSQAYMNGVHTTHAGITMCSLIGNLGFPGASHGAMWHSYRAAFSQFTTPDEPNETPSITIVDWPDVMMTGKRKGEDFPIKMAYFYAGNPLCCHCDTNKFLNEVWTKLEFIVVADHAMTDTAAYADLVLPAAQWFEQMDVPNVGPTATLNLSQKAIEPLYESKSDMDIVRELAERLGYGKYFNMTDEDALDMLFNGPLNEVNGISADRIREEMEVRFTPDDPHIAWREFSTESGRLEWYLEDPKPRASTNKEITPELIDRERLPNFWPAKEVWPETEVMKKYPLQFMSERPRFRVHSQWFSVKALRELDPEPAVKINPQDAIARGINDGDYVECYNDRGHGVGRAIYSEGIRPGILLYGKSWQISQHKAGCWSELLDNDYDEFGVNGNFMDCVCEIRPWTEGGAE